MSKTEPIGESYDEMERAVEIADGRTEMISQLNRLWIIIEAIETDNTVKADTIKRLRGESNE